MIEILTNADRARKPALFRQMFEARAAIFSDRLGWDVTVVDGQETDRYDELEHVLYVVAIDQCGDMTASLRLLPTTGDTMMQNEFSDFFNEPVDVVSPTIVECTRFCVHPPKAGASLDNVRLRSSELSIGLCSLCLDAGFEHVLGLYNAQMDNVYRRIGWRPELLAEARSLRGHLRVGLWEVSDAAIANMHAVADGYRFRTPLKAAA